MRFFSVFTKRYSTNYMLSGTTRSTNVELQKATQEMQEKIRKLKSSPEYPEFLERKKKEQEHNSEAFKEAINAAEESFKNFSVY